jgi:ribosome-associated protein
VIEITPGIAIDEGEIEERFIRSGGPGGQNVNKVASAVQLRFDAVGSPSLPDAVKQRLKAIAGSRMTNDGVIVITARGHRDQARNRAEARERLVALLARAAEPVKPRRPTRPTRASRAARTDAKTKRGGVKRLREKPRGEE